MVRNQTRTRRVEFCAAGLLLGLALVVFAGCSAATPESVEDVRVRVEALDERVSAVETSTAAVEAAVVEPPLARQADVEALGSRLDVLANTLETFRSETLGSFTMLATQDDVGELAADVAAMFLELTAFEARVVEGGATKDDVSALADRVGALVDTLADFEKRLTDLLATDQSVQSLSDDVAALREQAAALETAHETTQRSIAALSTRLATDVAALDDELKALGVAQQSTEAAVAAAQAAIASGISELASDVGAHWQLTQQIVETLDGAVASITALAARVESVSDRIEALPSLSALEGLATSADTDAIADRLRLVEEDVNARVAELASAVETINAAMISIAQSVSRLTTELSSLAEDIPLDTSDLASNDALAALRERIDGMAMRLTSLEGAVSSIDLDDVDLSGVASSEALANLANRVNSMQAQLGELADLLAELREVIEDGNN